MKKKKYILLLAVSIFLSSSLLSGTWIYTARLKMGGAASITSAQPADKPLSAKTEKAVLPPEGVVLPVKWGDMGAQMMAAGVIDQEKFEALYAQRGGLNEETRSWLTGTGNGELKINAENSGVLLNLLWALGLGNKNEILDSGPMQDAQYGGAGNFASTGGWSLAKGEAMNHYSMHSFISLTSDQQTLVAKVAQGIYRPCCNNPVHFPDCNHGMAMLGLLELMASQGLNEEEMYRVALQVNAYWFPSNYLTIAKFLESTGSSWSKRTPQEILGPDFSSISGYKQIMATVNPERRSSGGCGV